MTKQLLAVVLSLSMWTSSEKHNQPTPQETEAARYMYSTFRNVTMYHASNPNEIPALKRRMQSAIEMFDRPDRKVGHVAYPGKIPSTSNLVFSWVFEPYHSRMSLWVSVELVRMQQQAKTVKDFHEYMAVAYAHEMIHWELSESGKFPLQTLHRQPKHVQLQAEAVAWGVTLLEIVGPMIKQGRMNDKMVNRRWKELSSFGGDYNHPGWVKLFDNYIKIQ